MIKAFKTEMNLSPIQLQKLKQTIGVCRYVYNLYLSQSQSYYQTTGQFLSGYDFDKWINNVHSKIPEYAWIKEVSSKARKQSIMSGEKAYKNFFSGRAKFPRFKKKKSQDVKAYFPKNNKTDWAIERHRVKIPTLGWVRLKEYGYIPTDAIVKSGTVSLRADRVFVSVLCEVSSKPKESLSDTGVGIDLGLKDFAVLSDGAIFKNINKTVHVKKLEKKLMREQRALSRKYESKKKEGESATKGSNITKNILRVQRLHQRLANIRKAYILSVVTNVVKTKPQYVTIEDLNVRGIMKNRHLSKAVAKQGFYTFKLWLTNLCRKHGIELRQVDRFFPSSKTCSLCGAVKKKLSLSERVYKCEECGFELDRDLNAAINLRYAQEYAVLT